MTLLSFSMTDWYETLTPYILIFLLFAATIIMAFVGVRNWKSRRLALILIPIFIIIGSILEVMAYGTMGKKAFWWCDDEAYGFWGALIRCIPFFIVVYAQIASYVLYKTILLDGGDGDSLSIKPMAKSMVFCLPVAFIATMLLSTFGVIHGGKEQALAALGIMLVVLLAGTFKSTRTNIKTLGFGRGIAFTTFGVIYIIGLIAMVWGLVLIFLQLWLQTIILFLVVSVLCGALDSSAKSNNEANRVAKKTVKRVYHNGKVMWEDGYGGYHDFESDASRCNEEGWKHEELTRRVQEADERMENCK